ncbi:sterol desaturase, partial [Aquimarina celericrescens]|nr:sterol desaturase [Aquimarina celericrescens]
VITRSHHTYSTTKNSYGVYFGISLRIWDYIFKTNYIPEDSGTIEIGFPGDEQLPKHFRKQIIYGFGKTKT